MATIMEGLISLSNSEYRPCIVDGKKAVFHRWHEFCNVVEAGLAIGSHPAGQIKYTLGTVEFEDGTIEEVAPHKIKFADFKVDEVWKEQVTKEGDAT